MATIVLDIRGIRGESRVAGYQGCLDAVAVFDSQEVPVSQVPGSTGRTVGRAALADFQVVRYVDSASPAIAKACSGGQEIREIRILLFRMLDGQMVNHMTYKLVNSYITRLTRQSEDAAGTVFGHQINDAAETLVPSANAGAAAALTRQLVADRPTPRPAKESPWFRAVEGDVERLWIRPAAVSWAYQEYKNGARQGTTMTGWHFEEGVDIGESSLVTG